MTAKRYRDDEDRPAGPGPPARPVRRDGDDRHGRDHRLGYLLRQSGRGGAPCRHAGPDRRRLADRRRDRLVGALVYAELAARRPGNRRPICLSARRPGGRSRPSSTAGRCCFVIQSGGMAAVATFIFASYLGDLVALPAPEAAVAAAALALLTLVNCLGVRRQHRPERADGAQDRRHRRGRCRRPAARAGRARGARGGKGGTPLGLVAALTPVMFAYGGWCTSSFIAGEMRDPRRDLARVGCCRGLRRLSLPPPSPSSASTRSGRRVSPSHGRRSGRCASRSASAAPTSSRSASPSRHWALARAC